MKRAILCLVAAVLVGCASHNQPPQQASAPPVNKYCPVNTSDPVDPKVTTVYKGQVIGFCCTDCIDEFKKNPDKYVATMK